VNVAFHELVGIALAHEAGSGIQSPAARGARRWVWTCVLAVASHGILDALRLEVLHVLELPAGLAVPSMVNMTGAVREEAERDLARRVDALAQYQISVKGRVKLGRAAEVIAAAVEANPPLVLVLGTHSRGKLDRALFGSVAEHSLRLARCPVLIVPQGSVSWLDDWKREQRPLMITAGMDFSPASQAALQWLRNLRKEKPCDVDIVYLYRPLRESNRLGLPLVAGEDEGQGEIASILERELRARVGELPGTGSARVRARPLWGDEINPLVWEGETDGADLILVGTSQGSGPSTALDVLRSAKTPVLCVPLAAETKHQAPAREPLRHVAVFTDMSELGDAAVSEAVWLLRGRGQLTICHVARPEEAGSDGQSRERIERKLPSLAVTGAAGQAIRIKTLVHENPQASEGIVQAIRRIGPDLVVMGSHGRSGVSRAVLGSVAESVVRQTSMSVVIVPPPGRRGNPAV
jgi:nucleotide-binding universal stress UspA family protein